MRHHQYFNHSLLLLVCVLLLASDRAFANNLEFHGCWEPEYVITHYADGRSVKGNIPCVEFYDTASMVMSSACYPGFERREDVKITDADSAGFSIAYKYASTKYAFQRQGDTLVLDSLNDVMIPTASKIPDKAIIKREIIKKFKNASSPADCLPPQIIVTKDDVFRHFRILDLVISSLENTVRTQVFMSLSRQFNRKIPAQGLGDHNIRRMLEHVDRISSNAAKEIRLKCEALENKIKDIFFARGHYDGSHIWPDLADENAKDWLVGAMEEVLQAQTISSYLMTSFPNSQIGFLDVLFPWDEVGNKEKEYMQKEKSSKEYGLGEEFLRDRMMLMWVLDTPVMQNRLPNGNKFPELMAMGLRNAAIAKKNSNWRFHSARGVERAVGFTAQALWSEIHKEVMTDDVRNEIEKEVQVLASRIKMLEPWGKPDCSSAYTKGLDLKSVADAKGDWTKFRLANGKSIEQGSEEHVLAAHLIQWECAGTKDLAIVRKIFEDVVAAQKPVAKYSADCALAHWLRYGIGGKKDSQRADEIEASYANRAGGNYKCHRRYPIDPNDPWADLK
jgi:hypothetical protein